MVWSESDIQFLKDNYPKKGKMWCAEMLNKQEGSIRHMASKLKLRIDKDSDFFIEFQKRAAQSKVGRKRPNHSELMKKYYQEGRFEKWVESAKTRVENGECSKIVKDYISKNGHPKGFLNKSHNEKTKEKLSVISKTMWSDKSHFVNSEEMKQIRSDNMSKNQFLGKLRNGYSRGRQGTYDINGNKIFFRSLWEANYALYLDHLKMNGKIFNWTFEEDTFWFDKIKRGVRSYKPDFKILNNDGSFYYIEVKGYMDSKSKTKLNRMRIYHPLIKIKLVEQKEYKQTLKDYQSIIEFYS